MTVSVAAGAVSRTTAVPLLAVAGLALLVTGCGAGTRSVPKRLTPAELEAQQRLGAGAGTSGVAGIRTTILNGDPERAGLYTIRLEVPANTRIEAHDHPDDRNAVVSSGTWYFGYGNRFEESALKALAPGSFYTEPPNEMHFARTGDVPVILTITGYGPTGTRYAKP